MAMRRIVRRVTVIDGVDMVNVFVSTIPILFVNGVKLIPFSIGPNSVTYDIEFVYNDAGSNLDLMYTIRSNLISDGTDIDEEISDFVEIDAADLHVRDVTNGRVVTNNIVVEMIP